MRVISLDVIPMQIQVIDSKGMIDMLSNCFFISFRNLFIPTAFLYAAWPMSLGALALFGIVRDWSYLCVGKWIERKGRGETGPSSVL